MKFSHFKISLRLLTLCVFVFTVAGIVGWALEEAELINRENHALKYYEQGEWQQAAAILEGILQDRENGCEKKTERIRGQLAKCYFKYAFYTYNLPMRETLKYCRKAYDLDPGAITEPSLKRWLQKQQQEK